MKKLRSKIKYFLAAGVIAGLAFAGVARAQSYKVYTSNASQKAVYGFHTFTGAGTVTTGLTDIDAFIMTPNNTGTDTGLLRFATSTANAGTVSVYSYESGTPTTQSTQPETISYIAIGNE